MVRRVRGFVGFQIANSPLWAHYGAQFPCQRACGDAASGVLLIPLVLRGPGSRFRRVGGFGAVALTLMIVPCWFWLRSSLCPHTIAQFGHVVEGLTLATAG